jgi:CBS domain-containing protein
MRLKDILSAKPSAAIYAVGPEATLREVVDKLVQHRVGSLLICILQQGDLKPIGIVTERDLLYAQSAGKGPLEAVKVSEIMTTGLITGSPEDGVEQVMGLMTTRRIRHLPVLDRGKLVGIVSIGDLVKAQYDRLAMENRFMKDYIQTS